MKEVLDDQGILFVSDEVQTGWGRTGDHFWGYQAHGIVPDMLTFAKGLGNGLPIGGVVARAELMDSVTANSISTFGGNPLVATGALAVLDYLAAHDLTTNARVVGARLADGLRRLAEDRPAVAEVRGKGLMQAVELVEPGTRTPAPALAARSRRRPAAAASWSARGACTATCSDRPAPNPHRGRGRRGPGHPDPRLQDPGVGERQKKPPRGLVTTCPRWYSQASAQAA